MPNKDLTMPWGYFDKEFKGTLGEGGVGFSSFIRILMYFLWNIEWGGNKQEHKIYVLCVFLNSDGP